MKKLLALLLAAVMALSCVGALAESEETESFAMPEMSMTTVSKLTVNSDMLLPMLGAGQMDEKSQELYGNILALVNALGSRAVVTPEGCQIELTLKDGAVATIAAGMTEEGVVLVSDLFPSYALMLSNETIAKIMAALGQINVEGILTAVIAHTQKLSQDILAKVGQPEMGEYVFDGSTFTVRMPLEITPVEMVQMEIAELKALLAEDAIAPLLAKANVDVAAKLDEFQAQMENAENVPASEIFLYSNPEKEGLVYITMAFATEDQMLAVSGGAVEEGIAFHVLAGPATLTSEDAMREAARTGAANAFAIDSLVVPAEDGNMTMTGNVYAAGMHVSVIAETKATETGAEETASVYFMDSEDPLLTMQSTMTMGGELTADLSTEGKTVLDVETLVKGDADEAVQGLMMDVVSYGLNNVVANAAAYMPDEVISLINLFSAPAEEEGEPIAEPEIEQVEDVIEEVIEEVVEEVNP